MPVVQFKNGVFKTNDKTLIQNLSVMAKDSKFVSAELHEIQSIAAKFNAPEPLLFFIQNEMARNAGTYSKKPVVDSGCKPEIYKPAFRPGKVLRTQFYSVLEAMGYKK